jgi:hypothetical protein
MMSALTITAKIPTILIPYCGASERSERAGKSICHNCSLSPRAQTHERGGGAHGLRYDDDDDDDTTTTKIDFGDMWPYVRTHSNARARSKIVTMEEIRLREIRACMHACA